MKRPTALMLIGIVLIGLAPFSTLGAYGLNSWCFCFKTAEDGHKLVYPWGALGFVVGAPAGGYVITSEQQYKLLRRYLKANAVVWLVLVGITSWIQIYLSLTLADSGGVSESIFHALPDMVRNFYTVSAWPGHERNLRSSPDRVGENGLIVAS